MKERNLIKTFNIAINIIVNNRSIRYILIDKETLTIYKFESYYAYLLYLSSSYGAYIYLDFRLSAEHTKEVNGYIKHYKSPSVGLIPLYQN